MVKKISSGFARAIFVHDPKQANCFACVREAKAGIMFFEHKKQMRWGRENFVLTKTKLFVTDSL